MWVAIALIASSAAPHTLFPNLGDFSPRFNLPSTNLADNLPIGNGEFVANVWVNASDGDLVVLLGRSDTFSSLAMSYKLGRIRLQFRPSPFLRPAAFTQILHLENATIEVSARRGQLAVHALLWVDSEAGVGKHAGAATALHVEVNASVPINLSVVPDLWRGTGEHNVSAKFTGNYGHCGSWQLLDGDTVAPPSALQPGELAAWSLSNTRSIYTETLEDHLLGTVANSTADPLLHRTSGALVRLSPQAAAGEPGEKPRHGRDARFMDSLHVSKPAVFTALTVFTHTWLPRTNVSWLRELRERASEALELRSREMSKQRSAEWWSQLWGRSHLVVANSSARTMRLVGHTNGHANGSSEGMRRAAARDGLSLDGCAHTAHKGGQARTTTAKVDYAGCAWNVSRGYTLARYLAAIQGRGAFPVHFNGGTVTWGYPHAEENPDFRSWGGAYWFQNTRHIYWPMIAAGDWDFLVPLFRMYVRQLPVMEARAQTWWNASGGVFAETAFFFGAYQPVDYGCNRSHMPDVASRFIKHHYEGGLELCYMGLRAYEHSGDREMLQSLALPFCLAMVQFYDTRYPRDANGTLYVSPAQGLETCAQGHRHILIVTLKSTVCTPQPLVQVP